jgi:hypothetical protein
MTDPNVNPFETSIVPQEDDRNHFNQQNLSLQNESKSSTLNDFSSSKLHISLKYIPPSNTEQGHLKVTSTYFFQSPNNIFSFSSVHVIHTFFLVIEARNLECKNESTFHFVCPNF